LARYEHVQRHVIDARYLGDYKVWLEFNDGRKGVVDLSDDLYGENFESLREKRSQTEVALARSESPFLVLNFGCKCHSRHTPTGHST